MSRKSKTKTTVIWEETEKCLCKTAFRLRIKKKFRVLQPAMQKFFGGLALDKFLFAPPSWIGSI